ncbi:MAG: ABC transporter substrate-binding protein [Alphaproteobacteria bacterium]|nr:ABC transporter substrate-binding protein [Alphaproteobacteria bacterium]
MRAVLLCFFALFLAAAPAAAQGTNSAEQFVAGQIRDGLAILSDSGQSAAAREQSFEKFLLGTTDLKRIALFTLGNASATPAQRDAFVAAFNIYATAVYRSYFQRYSGQSLAVTGSRANGPGDTIVHTHLIDPNGGPPLTVDFRVRTDGERPLVIDIGIAGVWLALTQHDDFAAFLARNNGDVDALTAHLLDVAKTYR